MPVHDRLESLFTIVWNGCSRSIGMGVHDASEYALMRFVSHFMSIPRCIEVCGKGIETEDRKYLQNQPCDWPKSGMRKGNLKVITKKGASRSLPVGKERIDPAKRKFVEGQDSVRCEKLGMPSVCHGR
jgi:hypothetical protein